MRSDKEDNAQQSTGDNPTTTKRSPLKETPSSLQRLRQAIAEEVGERRISAAVGLSITCRYAITAQRHMLPQSAASDRCRSLKGCAHKGAHAQCCNMTVPVMKSAMVLWL